MYRLNTKLAELENKGERIKVALVGAGQMGNGMVSQMTRMKGMEAAVVVDINIELAKKALLDAGINENEIVEVSTVEEINKVIENGQHAICKDFKLASKADKVQAVVDATGGVALGAEIAFNTILNKKHIVKCRD